MSTYPARHLVCICLPVVVVEDHDGGDHRAGHHEHDAVKIRPWEYNSIRSPATYAHTVHEHCSRSLYFQLNFGINFKCQKE